MTCHCTVVDHPAGSVWVAHTADHTCPQHRDTKTAALALVDTWTTELAAAACWPMTVTPDRPSAKEQP